MSLKEEAQEAFFNIGKLAKRIPSDEARRLEMLVQVICTYVSYLENRNSNDEDDDSRC